MSAKEGEKMGYMLYSFREMKGHKYMDILASDSQQPNLANGKNLRSTFNNG
jgi:hypothetical protein